MNISKYDSVISLADKNGDEFVMPSKFDMIKMPATRMRTTDGAPVVTEDTEKILLREPSAFAQWAYLKVFGTNSKGTAKKYHVNDGSDDETILVPKYDPSYQTKSDHLLRCVDEFVNDSSGKEIFSAAWPYLNLLAKVIIDPDDDSISYGISLKNITESELQERYPDYNVRASVATFAKGQPLTLENMKPLNSTVKLARDVLTGGFDYYRYYSPLAIELFDNAGSTGFIELGKRYSARRNTTTKILTISQGNETKTDSYASGLILHAEFPADTISGFDVYFSYKITYNSTSYASMGSWVTGGSSGSKTIVRGPYSYSGNTIDIYNKDIGLTSFDEIISQAKTDAGWDFLTVDSSTYKASAVPTGYTVVGSAEYGDLKLTNAYVLVLPKLSVDIN